MNGHGRTTAVQTRLSIRIHRLLAVASAYRAARSGLAGREFVARELAAGELTG